MHGAAGVFNSNTDVYAQFGRYVLVSKSRYCSLGHRASGIVVVANFSLSFGKFDLILNRQLMTVFRRVKRTRFKLVEGSSCKSLFLFCFFSASPFPNKMWIWDGDRASGIILSFGEEITAFTDKEAMISIKVKDC